MNASQTAVSTSGDSSASMTGFRAGTIDRSHRRLPVIPKACVIAKIATACSRRSRSGSNHPLSSWRFLSAFNPAFRFCLYSPLWCVSPNPRWANNASAVASVGFTVWLPPSQRLPTQRSPNDCADHRPSSPWWRPIHCIPK